MNDYNIKEVNFMEYCKKCVHTKVYEGDDPCNECLTQGWNEGSKKPIYYKEKASTYEESS